MAVFCGVAALMGHLKPVYLDFKGGKGVATAAGVIFALNWIAGLIVLGVWLLVFLPFRYVSLASIAAAITLPVAQYFTGARFWGDLVLPVHASCIVAAFLVVMRHRENIQRLRNGEEKKISFSKGRSA